MRMEDLTPEQRDKLTRFKDRYEELYEAGGTSGLSASFIAAGAHERTLAEIPLTEEELKFFKIHYAMYTVNGGSFLGDH